MGEAAMQLVVPKELQEYVLQEVASGKFRSEEHVVSEALRLLQERERKRDELLQDIELGLERLEAGKGIPIADEAAHDQFFRDIEERGNERRKSMRGQK